MEDEKDNEGGQEQPSPSDPEKSASNGGATAGSNSDGLVDAGGEPIIGLTLT